MQSPLLMSADTSVLVLVDYQGRLMPAIDNAEHVLARAAFLAEVATLLGVPVLGTEQSPDKLGPNVEQIARWCEAALAKDHFGACADGLAAELQRRYEGRDEMVIAGCEAHVCLLQSALGLLEAGLRVRVVADACGSRFESDRALAMSRLAAAGATIVSAEMVAFEWLTTSRHPRFRDVSALIKQRD
ncbi:isochorismatase family protein [Gephyromycinifex aptenodytis]|uniref:isochorismatase family protein n=1 Tax=Gephyromycinifex aptenodytis TaxID=2716227 RepID=UPI001B2FF20A|nr:isochorismatase family protein [Gephyromycinifex aptenodytis]